MDPTTYSPSPPFPFPLEPFEPFPFDPFDPFDPFEPPFPFDLASANSGAFDDFICVGVNDREGASVDVSLKSGDVSFVDVLLKK